MTPEIAVKVHLPFRRLGFCVGVHILVIVILGIWNSGIIKRLLHLHNIPPRVIHRLKPEFFCNLRRHSLCLIGRRVFLQKGVELFPAPLPGLFNCRFTAAGDQQPEKIREILRDRMDTVAPAIHRADCEHHSAEAADKTVVDAVAPRPADYIRTFGRTEIRYILFPPLNSKWSKVNSSFQKTLIKLFHLSALLNKYAGTARDNRSLTVPAR